MKDFLDKFFDLCREYQEEIPPQKMAEILRDYADRLDGWRILTILNKIVEHIERWARELVLLNHQNDNAFELLDEHPIYSSYLLEI